MKSFNISRVLRTLWYKRCISRIDIAKELNLDKSTITHIISALIDKGIVKEIAEGQASPQGGRKPIYLTINKDYGCIAGFEIQPNYYEVVVVNLNGDILFSNYIRRNISSRNITSVLSDLIENIMSNIKKKRLNLIGIGLGFSGILNPEEGIIYQSIPLQITKSINILSSLKSKINTPILIENDANCCAWGELAFHKLYQLQNFLFVLIEFREEEVIKKNYGGIAVGLSIVINGKVYYGSSFSSGEFRSVFAQPTDPSQFSLSKDELLNINENENIFIRFTEELSENLALIINILNIHHIFISSSNVKYKEKIIPILREKIQKNFPYPAQNDYIMRFSSLENKAVAYGAAGMLLERLFALPEIPQDRKEIYNDNLRLFLRM